MGDVKGVSNEVARTLVATGRTDPLSCVHHLGGLSEATSHGGARDLCRKKIAASTSLARGSSSRPDIARSISAHRPIDSSSVRAAACSAAEAAGALKDALGGGV